MKTSLINSDKEEDASAAKKFKWAHLMETSLVDSDKEEETKPDYDSNNVADNYSMETA